jgi:hypothetical protein
LGAPQRGAAIERISTGALDLVLVEQNLVDIAVRIREALWSVADESAVAVEAVGRIEITHDPTFYLGCGSMNIATRAAN